MSGLWQRDQKELLYDLRDLETPMCRDYAAVVALIAELDQRTAHAELDYPSLAELLRDVLRISPREAKRRITYAHAVTEVALVSGGSVPPPLPAIAEALHTGCSGRSTWT
jgi:hypothetical protein